MVSAMLDRYRQAVYQAEDQWSSILDRGGRVDFFGSTLTAPVQMRFGTIDDVRTFVDHICRAAGAPKVDVRHRKGGTRAHYEIDGGVIAIPSNHPWAMRESVVLHEVAHHLCVTENSSSLHDRHFTTTMLTLVREHMGHEAELLLRTGYQAAGAPV